MADPTIKEIIDQINREWGPCIGLYVHGSSVFLEDVVTPKDVDLLAVVDDDDDKLKREIKCASPDSQFEYGSYEVSVYAKSFWFAKLAAMDLTMITCAYLPSRFVLRELHDPRLQQMTWKDPARRMELVQSVWSYAEYTWIKARRVLDRWEDPYKSSKNVYFVFRILELGCQLLTHDKILDFHAANRRYFEIRNLYETYNILPGDFELVEAALARSYEDEIARFQAAVHPQKPPAFALSERTESPSEPSNESCSICLYPCDSGDRSENDETGSAHGICTLLCGHTFHLHCVAELIRREASRGITCPLCRRGICIKIDREAAILRELERRGIKRPRFTGYPATIVVEHLNDQNSAPVTAA